MDIGKPLSWIAFIGCVLTMVSLLLVFGMNVYWGGQARARSQPLASLAGMVLLIFGIILVRIGSKKTE